MIGPTRGSRLRADDSAASARRHTEWSVRRSFLALLFGAFIASTAPCAGAAPRDIVNKPAPGFDLTDLNGRPLRLSSFRGKVVLLNFWATWCGPCRVEMPVFASWQNQYGGQGLQIIGISLDDATGPPRRLVQRLRLNYPVAMGDDRLAARYGGVLGLPLTFLIDRDGVVRACFQGDSDLKEIERQMRALLARPRLHPL
jgi:cytochrome c biogenesis protein CcmG/thiol:disulfide interchange protein DsbE